MKDIKLSLQPFITGKESISHVLRLSLSFIFFPPEFFPPALFLLSKAHFLPQKLNCCPRQVSGLLTLSCLETRGCIVAVTTVSMLPFQRLAPSSS